MPDSLTIEEAVKAAEAFVSAFEDRERRPGDKIQLPYGAIRLVLSRLSELEALRVEAVKALGWAMDRAGPYYARTASNVAYCDAHDRAASTLALLRGKGEDDG